VNFFEKVPRNSECISGIKSLLPRVCMPFECPCWGALQKCHKHSLSCATRRFHAQHPPPFIITTGRGTWHKANPKDERTFDIHESAMNAAWLLERGVPHDMILEESSSMETVGNAFFTRVLHADVLSLKHIAGSLCLVCMCDMPHMYVHIHT